MTFETAAALLVRYGEQSGLLPESERDYALNQILALFGQDDFAWPQELPPVPDLETLLRVLLDEAALRGLLKRNDTTCRDLFDTRLMNALTPRPQQVIDRFWALYDRSPQAATDDFYAFCQKCDYIRTYRICKDVRWQVDSEYGPIELSINLSKPEKDAAEIAAALHATKTDYPKCALCMQNVGYAGRENHPARSTLRMIPLQLAGEPWGFQYSPYVYYNEHCIVMSREHVPMCVTPRTFDRLLEFVARFPHYFLGSNAGLPVVGGSILSHEHYQGGRHEFPMVKAPVDFWRTLPGYDGVCYGVIHWPMAGLRLRGEDPQNLSALAAHILDVWQDYSDPTVEILARTGNTPHNAVTPIARRRDGLFELDLVLRNNRADERYPMGIFHPHADKHHIKKENIGLIEVMGLAVLPARLNRELRDLARALCTDAPFSGDLEKHAAWAQPMRPKCRGLDEETVWQHLLQETGHVFVDVLKDAGVFKPTREGRAALERFLQAL